MLLFAAAVFGLIITPGPGVLSTAGVGAAYGARPGFAYIAGLCCGTNVANGLVISGLAAILLSVPALRTVLVWLSAAYLLYLALKIALAGSKLAFISPDTAPGFFGGLILNCLNPKAYVVASTLFNGFNFAPDDFTFEITVKLLIYNALWIPLHLVWLYAGVSLHRLDMSPSDHSAINAAMAAAMLAVVAIAAWAQA